MVKSNYWVTDLDLRVIWPLEFKFHTLDRVRPPVDREHSQLTHIGQNEKTNYGGTNVDQEVILSVEFTFRIFDRVRPSVDRKSTPSART